MVEDDMAGSIITERLKRLREEGEAAQRGRSIMDPLPAIPLPVSERARAEEYVAVEVDIFVPKKDETGSPVIEIETVSTVADSSAGSFEFLIHKGWIQRNEDAEGMGMVRQRAGLRFRSLVEDAAVTPLKAQNYEGGGGGGGTPRDPATHTIDCIRHLASVEREIGKDRVDLMRAVICEDARPWEGKTGQAVRREVDRLLEAVDHLAAYFSLVTSEEVAARWRPKKQAPQSARSAAPPHPPSA